MKKFLKEDWLKSQYSSLEERKEYLRKNYIPDNLELTVMNYAEFFEKREELLLQKLKEILLEK